MFINECCMQTFTVTKFNNNHLKLDLDFIFRHLWWCGCGLRFEWYRQRRWGEWHRNLSHPSPPHYPPVPEEDPGGCRYGLWNFLFILLSFTSKINFRCSKHLWFVITAVLIAKYIYAWWISIWTIYESFAVLILPLPFHSKKM